MSDFITAVDRVAFYLPGGRPVYWYGIMVTLAILCAFGLFMLISYKKGIDIDFSLELFIWVVPLAVVFCRLFYVVPRLGTEYHLDSWQGFVDTINISNGGLTIIGGIFGGALGIFFCCLRNRKYTFAQVADCVVIALLLGQIIGRWGNFFNQELYGVEVTQDWMKHFPLAVYIESTGTWHYASFFYEGVLNAIGLAIALVIFFVPKKPVKTGTIMIFYVGWYGLVRGSLEFIKGTDPMTIGNTEIKMVQLICYIMLIVAIVLMILLQLGKIRFETKWFQRLCEKKREETAKKLAAEGVGKNGEGGELSEENGNPVCGDSVAEGVSGNDERADAISMSDTSLNDVETSEEISKSAAQAGKSETDVKISQDNTTDKKKSSKKSHADNQETNTAHLADVKTVSEETDGVKTESVSQAVKEEKPTKTAASKKTTSTSVKKSASSSQTAKKKPANSTAKKSSDTAAASSKTKTAKKNEVRDNDNADNNTDTIQ